MSPVALLLIPIYFVSYYPASYAVLAMTGVASHRNKRALAFGVVIAVLQVMPPLLLALIAGDFGAIVGLALSVVLSYKYVASVLAISCYKNVAIIIFLPMVSSIVAGAAYFVIFTIIG